MRILFIGDIFASPGRKVLEIKLRDLQDQYQIDFTVANGENSKGGSGMDKKTLEDLTAFGVDCFTMGNHTWGNKDIYAILQREERVIRPLNFAQGTVGKGSAVFTLPDGQKLAVLNLIGRTNMEPADHPFLAAEAEVKRLRQETGCIIVDFHAEATSEKKAMGYFLDGRVSAVIGTHTHIQTNDARILPRGTAYLTDVGMTGPYESILGVDNDIIVRRFLTGQPERFVPATGDLQFNGAVIDIAPDGKAKEIKTLNFSYPSL